MQEQLMTTQDLAKDRARKKLVEAIGVERLILGPTADLSIAASVPGVPSGSADAIC